MYVFQLLRPVFLPFYSKLLSLRGSQYPPYQDLSSPDLETSNLRSIDKTKTERGKEAMGRGRSGSLLSSIPKVLAFLWKQSLLAGLTIHSQIWNRDGK